MQLLLPFPLPPCPGFAPHLRKAGGKYPNYFSGLEKRTINVSKRSSPLMIIKRQGVLSRTPLPCWWVWYHSGFRLSRTGRGNGSGKTKGVQFSGSGQRPAAVVNGGVPERKGEAGERTAKTSGKQSGRLTGFPAGDRIRPTGQGCRAKRCTLLSFFYLRLRFLMGRSGQ